MVFGNPTFPNLERCPEFTGLRNRTVCHGGRGGGAEAGRGSCAIGDPPYGLVITAMFP